MKASIAVSTVSGKAYYLILKQLREKGIPFVSLTPGEPVPAEIKAVITTEKERQQVCHGKVLTYSEGTDLEALVSYVLQIIQGKERYERLTIGVDPGEVLGLAVLADEKVIETENCFSVDEAVEKIKSILKNIENSHTTSVSVKVGDGVPAYKEKLLIVLDKALPQYVALESVSEAGTSRYLNETKYRRGLRDMISAIKIAGRNGNTYERRRTIDSNS